MSLQYVSNHSQSTHVWVRDDSNTVHIVKSSGTSVLLLTAAATRWEQCTRVSSSSPSSSATGSRIRYTSQRNKCNTTKNQTDTSHTDDERRELAEGIMCGAENDVSTYHPTLDVLYATLAQEYIWKNYWFLINLWDWKICCNEMADEMSGWGDWWIICVVRLCMCAWKRFAARSNHMCSLKGMQCTLCTRDADWENNKKSKNVAKSMTLLVICVAVVRAQRNSKYTTPSSPHEIWMLQQRRRRLRSPCCAAGKFVFDLCAFDFATFTYAWMCRFWWWSRADAQQYWQDRRNEDQKKHNP